jgi:hypothetical protein
MFECVCACAPWPECKTAFMFSYSIPHRTASREQYYRHYCQQRQVWPCDRSRTAVSALGTIVSIMVVDSAATSSIIARVIIPIFGGLFLDILIELADDIASGTIEQYLLGCASRTDTKPEQDSIPPWAGLDLLVLANQIPSSELVIAPLPSTPNCL